MNKSCLLFITFISIAFLSNVKAQNEYELLYVQGKFDRIIGTAQTIIENKNPAATDFYWYTLALDKKGNIKTCLSVLEEAGRIFPENKELEIQLANTYYESGNYFLAAPIFERYPEKTDCRIKLANIYEFKSAYQKAISIFEGLYKNDTTNILYLKHLGENYYKTDSIDTALFFYHKAFEINPFDQPVAYRIALIHLKKNEFGKSVKVCDTILFQDSLNRKFLKQRGFSYFKWKKYENAVSDFSKLLSNGDSGTFTLKYLGISELSSNDFHTGRKHLLKAYSKDSADFEICFYLGRAFLNSMEQEKGLVYFEKAENLLKPQPELLTALYQEKASLYSALERFDDALKMHSVSYELIPKPEYLFYIASIYQNRKDDKQKAYTYYESFLDKLPPKENSEHEFKNGMLTISMRKIAEDNMKKIREDLFFEGELKD